MLRLFRLAGNALAFSTIIYIAVSFLPSNPLLALLLSIVAYDQLEDLAGVSPPGASIPLLLDIIYECFCIAVGLLLALFGYSYYSHFYAPIHLALLLSGLVVVLSSVADIRDDLRKLRKTSSRRALLGVRKSTWGRES